MEKYHFWIQNQNLSFACTKLSLRPDLHAIDLWRSNLVSGPLLPWLALRDACSFHVTRCLPQLMRWNCSWVFLPATFRFSALLELLKEWPQACRWAPSSVSYKPDDSSKRSRLPRGSHHFSKSLVQSAETWLGSIFPNCQKVSYLFPGFVFFCFVSYYFIVLGFSG